VLVAPSGTDREILKVRAQQSLKTLNVSGDQKVKRIQLLSMPEIEASEDTDLFDQATEHMKDYGNKHGLVPRAILYFISQSFFAKNSKELAAHASAKDLPDIVLELKDMDAGTERKFAIYAPPLYLVINNSSAGESEPGHLSVARKVVSGKEAYWNGVAHKRASIAETDICPWVQRVIDIEAERS